jgi:hypothetical protein
VFEGAGVGLRHDPSVYGSREAEEGGAHLRLLDVPLFRIDAVVFPIEIWASVNFLSQPM